MKPLVPLPLISVVVPYHNEGELLKLALGSISEQEYAGPVEIIVVDDCSTVPPPVSDIYQWPVRLIRLDVPTHAAGARQAGINACTGEYVCFLDSDDVFEPDRLQSHVEVMERLPDVVMVGGQTIVVRSDHKVLYTPFIASRVMLDPEGKRGVIGGNFQADACLNYCFHTASFTVRRQALDRAGGFNASLCWGEEWDVQVRVAQLGKVAYVPRPAMRYVLRDGSITQTENPRKYESSAQIRTAWRRTVSQLSYCQRADLAAAISWDYLLAAQVWHETGGSAWKSWVCAIMALTFRPSQWAFRSIVRFSLLLIADVLKWPYRNAKKLFEK